ncbi:DUF1033 family protein [Streptococcus pneumoniae]
MYCVVEMYGDYEPWWFLEGWEDDIVKTWTFDDYYTALKHYKHHWVDLAEGSPFYRSRSDLMTIFWDPGDERWCEECGEYIQQYHSLMLLEDDHVIPQSKFRPGYNKQNASEKHRVCQNRNN